MAGKRVVIDGVFLPYDKMHAPLAGRMDGTMSDPTLEVGGGPVFPGAPVDPGYFPPGMGPGLPGGPTDPGYSPPWARPPSQPPILPVPPDITPPPPGSPPVIVPGTKPVNPIVPPAAIVVEYPGIGKVVVPQPVAPPA